MWSQEVGPEAPQEPNWCVKGDEVEGSWQCMPRPLRGREEAASLVEMGGERRPSPPSFRIDLISTSQLTLEIVFGPAMWANFERFLTHAFHSAFISGSQ